MFNPYVGLCKFIMALLVVAIHVEPFTGDIAFYYNNCLARIADPMFFTLSAYFLFDKLLASNWDKTVFVKQIKRLLKYYGVWLVIYSPVIMGRTWARTDSVSDFLWQVVKQIFLSGPYGALWFLPALLLGLMLTYFIGKHTSPLFCLVISCPFFLLSVMEMEYFALVKDIAWLTAINDFFVSIFGWLGNGVNFGWFFCAMGLYLAAKKESISENTSAQPCTNQTQRNFCRDAAFCIISFILLVLECTIIRQHALGISYGVMLCLIPVTYYLMQVLLQIPELKSTHLTKTDMLNNEKPASAETRHKFTTTRFLQDMSLLIFPLHYGIMEGMEYLMRNEAWYMTSTAVQYVIVIVITCAISSIILFLGKKHPFFRHFYGK